MSYHLVSRCVRRSFLCGYDSLSKTSYDHRRDWLIERLFKLCRCFAVDLDGYAILSNHFHLVVYFDPKASERWSDEEVANRWIDAFPPRSAHRSEADRIACRDLLRETILEDAPFLLHARATLGNLSEFMKHLKQPIAWRANREDGCTGHFFENRFYSGALLDEESLLTTMSYVDLNPVRAKICKRIEEYRHTSLHSRLAHLANTPDRLKAAMEPLVSGLPDTRRKIPLVFQDYIDHLKHLVEPDADTSAEAIWFARFATLKKRQRAYGRLLPLREWAKHHAWRRVDAAWA